MAVAEVNQQIADVQKQQLKEDFGGKASNQFVDELKRSALFQTNWGELLTAAPTALSLMGSCWIAASHPKADSVSLADSMPSGGFKYLTNRKNPSLKSCLVDVCNNGGREAFTLAGRNMDALQIRSQRIVHERIDLVFKLLGPCTRGPDELEDFRDALNAFAKEARDCARLATETREAFSKWGRMVGELHSCTEAQMGTTSIKRDSTKIDESVAEVEKKFASQAATDAKTQAENATKSLQRAEERLDKAIDKVPGPWASALTSIVTGYTQAMPHIIAGVLPAVLAAANPMAGVAMALGGAAKTNSNGVAAPAQNGTQNGTVPVNGTTQVGTVTSDPAYTVAAELRPLVTMFYEFLGGETKKPDWSKFAEPTETEGAKKDEQSGTAYFLGTVRSYKNKLDVTTSEPNIKLRAVFDSLIEVTLDLQAFLKTQNSLNVEEIDAEKLASWKKKTKDARNDTVSIATVAGSFGGGSVPNPFSNIKIDVPKTDTAAQTAQMNGAAQGVQIAQQAADNAQANFDAAIAKQAKTAAAMAEIEQKLKRLQEEGQTLEQIKSVLRDCISVLVDLSVQIGKLEQFFIMLTTVIDNIVLVRCDSFQEEMDKGARRALANGLLKFSDQAKQTIYTSTLQIKAYFSLLQDISAMYTTVHRGYIMNGVDLCAELSKFAATHGPSEEVQKRLTDFTQKSAKEVNELVKTKQDEMLNGLRDRVRRAADTTKLLETVAANNGIKIDTSAKEAIKAGGESGKEAAQAILDAQPGATVTATEETDASAL